MEQKVFSKVGMYQLSKGSKLRTLTEVMAFVFKDLRTSVLLIVSFILGERGENIEGVFFQRANRNNQSI